MAFHSARKENTPIANHTRTAAPFVEFGLDGLALVPLAATAVAEQRLSAVEELLLPLADLDRVDLEGPRQLGQGPGLLGGLQSDPSLEGSRMSLLTCVGHDAPQGATKTFDQFNIPSGPVFGVHFSLERGQCEPTERDAYFF
jgi:hypothetical protein